MFSFIRFRPAALALIIPALLAACGGGGGGGSTPDTVPVVSAHPDAVSAERNRTLVVSVLANDSVTSGGKLQLVSVTSPAHGTAAVSGDTVTYTPAAGFYGKDSFNYTVTTAGVATASVTATVAVEIVAPVTMTGKVVDAPVGAKATILVGTKSFDATLDAQGNFATKVQLDAPTSMVSITAQGTGNMAHVKLASLVGDSQTVLDAAGATEQVSPATLANTNVTAFSTALYALLVNYNNGVVPATQQALDAASAKFGVIELVQRAALIRALSGTANEPAVLSMPATAADTLALATDRQLFRQFYSQAMSSHAARLLGIMEVQNSDARLSSRPAIEVSATKSLNFFLNDTGGSQAAVEMVLNPDGSGSFLTTGKRGTGTWSKTGSLTMTLSTPAVYRDVYFDDGSGLSYDVEHITKEVSVGQLAGGKEHGFVVVKEVGVRRFYLDARPDEPWERITVLAYSEWNRLAGPSEIAGATIGGLLKPVDEHDPVPSQLVMTFAADGGATSPQMAGALFGWTQQGTKLVVTVPNGLKQTIARLRVNSDGTEVWLARLGSDADYNVLMLYVVRAQPGRSVTETNLLNRWYKHYGPTGATLNTFSILVEADHTSKEFDNETIRRRATWTIENGNLVMSTYNGSVLRWQRSWTLLRDDAQGIVLFEKLAHYSEYMPEEPSVSYRIVRYERP